MAKREKIIEFLNEYLISDRVPDYSPIGLQIEGKDEVKKIVFGVSLNLMLIEKAVEEKADMIIVHHGMFFKRESAVISGPKKRRIQKIINNDITLLGYHLCLDMHEEIGNNVSIIKGMDLVEPQLEDIGYFGYYEDEIDRDEFSKKFDTLVNRESIKFLYGSDKIKKVYAVTGGAPLSITKAHELGCDTFISGEASESSMASAYELGMNFYAGGHHNTEVFGVKNLEKLIKDEFDVETKFIDIENPV